MANTSNPRTLKEAIQSVAARDLEATEFLLIYAGKHRGKAAVRSCGRGDVTELMFHAVATMVEQEPGQVLH